MKLSMLERFLLYLSKTDQDVLKHCTRYAKQSRKSLGAMVLFTGILAFFSGSYAVSTIFQDYDASSKSIEISNAGITISLLIGFIYSLMIMTFDREIVSVTNRSAALMRLPLAIIIGFVVALPLELKLLEGGINKQLAIESERENEAKYEYKRSQIESLNNEIAKLEEIVQKEKNEVAEWLKVMDAEVTGKVIEGRTGIKGEGPAFERAKQNMEKHQEFLEDAKNKLKQKENNYPIRIKQIQEEYKSQMIEQEYDLLTRIEALENIKEESDAAFWLAWGIRILFIMIEMFPALAKLFLQPSEYDAMLEARRRLNHQVTNAIGNKGLKEIEQDVTKAYTPPYLNDINKGIMK